MGSGYHKFMGSDHYYNGKIYLQNSSEQKEHIKDMFDVAKRFMVLMSPFWNLETFNYTFAAKMWDALSRGIDVFIICKENDIELLSKGLRASERKQLHILCASDFHTKLYFNDSVYLITSMNISQCYGKELGIVIQDRNTYKSSVFKYVIDYICYILRYEDRQYFRSYFENFS